ncbi:hypothetical protein CfE428DRAFT_3437 [Chthoniobacter flavus Ellin428]|uniref:Uncharacterized protein n=1 Tax=Chthoniobacter flavus Ellin428 TaxID=497964 RepID=B4D3E9_9BACT|nr:hypothetical protein [Chthoniobacter flavus]EDY19260.1 hypothetical protein CfE428DRAFT_3437 [Chthoniobacter flavus Ellin428]TCO88102.1 hypothetical protein EV701_119146 [Chthoniobacter flavus]
MRLLLVIVVVLPAIGSLAEDLRSSDGTIYHHIKEVKAEPDGLLFVYDKGIAKVDFERLSPEMQRRFGYDRQKAAVYRAHQVATVQENQQIVRVHEEKDLERIRKMVESGASGDELMYSGGLGSGTAARYTRQLQREMEAKQETTIAAARQPRTFWNAPFWQSPVVQVIGAVLRGAAGGGGRGGFDNHRGFSQDFDEYRRGGE